MDLVGLLLLKALVYFGVAVLGAWRWSGGAPKKWGRAALAATARMALGVVVGVPVGFFLRATHAGEGSAPFYLGFFALRFALWLLVFRIAFMKAPGREVMGLAAIGAVVNAVLDMALTEGLYGAFDIHFC